MSTRSSDQYHQHHEDKDDDEEQTTTEEEEDPATTATTPSMMSAPPLPAVDVRVIGDITCPFCFAAKRAIELAAIKSNLDLRLHWLPFQLDPQIGPEGADRLESYVKKFGPHVESMIRDPNHQLCRTGHNLNREAEAIFANDKEHLPPPVEYRYIEGSRVFNTMKCHMLVAHPAVAENYKIQNKLMDVFFRKFFGEGKDLSVGNELYDAAKECNIPREVVEEAVVKRNPGLEQKVRGLLCCARGVRGIPYFKFPKGEVLNGSVSIDIFQEVLEKYKQ